MSCIVMFGFKSICYHVSLGVVIMYVMFGLSMARHEQYTRFGGVAYAIQDSCWCGVIGSILIMGVVLIGEICLH